MDAVAEVLEPAPGPGPVERGEFRVPAHRFLGYLQDHDQTGNRAAGDRITAIVPPDVVKAGAGPS